MAFGTFDDDADAAMARGFDRLAAAEARLASARASLPAADRAALARFLMDIAAALLLLRSLREGLDRRSLDRAAGALELNLPAGLIARLPAAARVALLDLSALAEALSGALAAIRGASGGIETPCQNEKPRRRQDRPRLSLLTPLP